MNDEKLRASIARAVRFREWADGEEGLLEILKAVERDYIETWAQTDIADHGTRERIFARVCAVRDIAKTIRAVIADGAGAAAMIEQLSKLEQRKLKEARA